MSGTMKRCVATVVSEPFVAGAYVMLATFLEHNAWFDGDVIVFHHRDYSPLSLGSQAHLASLSPRVRFEEVQVSDYTEIFAFAENVVATPRRLRPAFLILEAFKYDQYDRIVTLDSDMLILGDLRHLFEVSGEFCVVRAHDPVADRPRSFFNTGTMAIGPPLLGPEVFHALANQLKEVVSFDRSAGKADQAVLNIFFKERPKTYVDERYNFNKRLVPETVNALDFLQSRDVRILHYVGEKPWNIKVRDTARHLVRLEAFWFEALLRVAPASLVGAVWSEMREQQVLAHDIMMRGRNVAQQRQAKDAMEAMVVERCYTARQLPDAAPLANVI